MWVVTRPLSLQPPVYARLIAFELPRPESGVTVGVAVASNRETSDAVRRSRRPIGPVLIKQAAVYLSDFEVVDRVIRASFLPRLRRSGLRVSET